MKVYYTVDGKRLTVAKATKISSGQPILCVAIGQLATYKIYLARCLRCQSRSEHIKFNYVESPYTGMSLEADNRRKSPVTLAVTAGYFFSLKKIMRENLVSTIQRTVRVSTDQHVYVCRSLQINIITYPLTQIISVVIFRSSEMKS
jgi:hypothetical protein